MRQILFVNYYAVKRLRGNYAGLCGIVQKKMRSKSEETLGATLNDPNLGNLGIFASIPAYIPPRNPFLHK